MGKVHPFAALFWALGIVLPTPDPARHRGTQSMSFYCTYSHAACTVVETGESVQF